MKKTQEEINELKQNWKNDPCWDIETTEGFEEHGEELLNFSIQTEAKWKAKAEEGFAKSFNGQVLQIKKELDELDDEVGLADSLGELATLEIARLNVRAIILLAEQVSNVNDAIEDRTAYEKYLRGN